MRLALVFQSDLRLHCVYLQIPFGAFALTSYGELATGQASRVSLEGQQIRWLGISLLGGNAGIEGSFELGLDSVEAVNEEDVSTPPLGESAIASCLLVHAYVRFSQ